MALIELSVIPTHEHGWWRCVLCEPGIVRKDVFRDDDRPLAAVPLEVEPEIQQTDYVHNHPKDGFLKDGQLWKWAANQSWPADPISYLQRLGIPVISSSGIPTVERALVAAQGIQGSVPDMNGWHVLTLLLAPSTHMPSAEVCASVREDVRDTLQGWEWPNIPLDASVLCVLEVDRVYLHTRDRNLVRDLVATRLSSIWEAVATQPRRVRYGLADWVIASGNPGGIEVNRLQVQETSAGVECTIAGFMGCSSDVIRQATEHPRPDYVHVLPIPVSAEKESG